MSKDFACGAHLKGHTVSNDFASERLFVFVTQFQVQQNGNTVQKTWLLAAILLLLHSFRMTKCVKGLCLWRLHLRGYTESNDFAPG